VKRLAHPNRVVFGAVVTSLAGMIQKSLHAGHEPMARTMPGRQTPSLEYRAEPLHRTRSEILEERRQKLRAHSSYDLDGDGFVRCAVDTAPHRTTPRGCVRLPSFLVVSAAWRPLAALLVSRLVSCCRVCVAVCRSTRSSTSSARCWM
jgi:hypothetical protein